MANTTAAEFWMVPDSAFHYRSICYCDKILKQHLRDVSGPRCWQIWPGFCMLIAGFTLVFHVNMCDKPVIQVDVVGPLDFPQQFRKKAKFPVKLAKHELWRCFLIGAAHVLCKAGTFIHPLQRQKWGTLLYILAWEGLMLHYRNCVKEDNYFA